VNAGWDADLLRLELAALQEEDFDVSLIGFDDEELARLLAAQDATEGLTTRMRYRRCRKPQSPPQGIFGSWTTINSS